MGQPISVVKKPGPEPGVVRFEANRSFTGMGHERFASPDDIIRSRPVDELARRLFATGDVKTVHVNGSVITLELEDGAAADELVPVISGLYIHYPPAGVDADAGEGEEAAPALSDPAG